MKSQDNNKKKMALLAIGNNCRGDDGLGWRFADLLSEKSISDIDVEYRYQLQVEDAELISHYDTVFFVDADRDQQAAGFGIIPCEAKAGNCYSSHRQDPGTVLYLCEKLFGRSPAAFIIAIGGYDWGFQIFLSDRAENNLRSAFQAFEKILDRPAVDQPRDACLS